MRYRLRDVDVFSRWQQITAWRDRKGLHPCPPIGWLPEELGGSCTIPYLLFWFVLTLRHWAELDSFTLNGGDRS